MIAMPTGVRVWLANGHSDLRRGMNGLALQVQQALNRDPHAGDLHVFRGRRGQRPTFRIQFTLGDHRADPCWGGRPRGILCQGLVVNRRT